jgi:long-subunit fatty acid transport protein
MKRTVLALMLSAAAVSAQASDLDYNFVQGSYKTVDLEGLDMDGFGLNGSFKFSDSFYGIVGYDKVSKYGVDLSETGVGVGFRHGISDKTDWVSELSYVRNDLDGFADNGYRIATGVRSMVSDKVELNGKVNYTDVSDFGKGFGVSLGGVYHVNDSFGITAGYDFNDRDGFDYDGWNIGGRFSF